VTSLSSRGAVSICVSMSLLLPGCLVTFDPARLRAPECEALPNAASAETFRYRDARCEERLASIDGAVLERFEYMVGDQRRDVTPWGLEHPGIGWVISNYQDGDEYLALATDGHQVHGGTAGDITIVDDQWIFRGAHHALHQIEWTHPAATIGEPGAGTLRIVVQWLIAGGRDHPVYAITYDASALAPTTLLHDTRAPAGDLAFTGRASPVAIDGVAWGDQHRFATIGEPFDMVASGWTYEEENTVPYTMTWSTAEDAEVGLVQTEPYARHPAGGLGSDLWIRWGESDPDGPLPEDFRWPFMLMQYNLEGTPPARSVTPRIAWGSGLGAVGRERYQPYGPPIDATEQPSGFPYQSYSTLVVLGRRSDEAVRRAVEDMEIASDTVVIARQGGQVRTMQVAGVGRDGDVPIVLAPPGWDARYAAWSLLAMGGELEIEIDPPDDRTLRSPLFVIEGMAALRSVRVDGRTLRDDEVLATPTDDAVWVTLRIEIDDVAQVAFAPP
jgi:hypothetical protein